MAVYLQNQTTRLARSRSGGIPHSDTLALALRTLTTPVHGIWGENDALVGRYMAERRRRFEALPAFATFTEVPGAGHWVMYDAPDAFNAALSRCLSRHGPA
jgi:pimeloyl-ACP methyl ester carboxylesterase